MNDPYRKLGIATVWQREGGDRDGADFRRRLRAIESGAAELNLDPAAVHVAAEIAAFDPVLDDEQRLALIMLITVSLAALQEGSTRLPVSDADGRKLMCRMLAPLSAAEPGGAGAVADSIEHLLAANLASDVIGRSPEDARPLLYLPPFIYHQRIRAAELRLAETLAQRLASKAPGTRQLSAIDAALADIIDRPAGNLLLSAEQRDAVRNAAGRSCAIISGGPGTGKTSIVLAIMRVLARIGIAPQRIALAAPTGKAAFRMGESIGQGLAQIQNPATSDLLLKDAPPQPRTIHRLLGYSPGRGRFSYHRNNPLGADAVIVDEGSMLDLSLMERLMDAVRPQAHLILLGDADQLPSVAAGAVFRDLVRALTAAQQHDRYRGVLTRLARNYRMDAGDPAGRAVLAAALQVNAAGGGAPVLPAEFVRREHASDLLFSGVEFIPASGLDMDFLKRWFDLRVHDAEVERLCTRGFEDENGFSERDRQSLEKVFDHAGAARVLCLTRVLSTGSERVNALMHRLRADRSRMAVERDFLPGEPVIVVRNDYERMLFNGDQGVVVRIRRAGRAAPMAVFKRDGGFAAFHLEALRESLELSYATTIHKAQGSEFDAVGIILPERDLPLLTREAIYTALTRSRHSVVIAGAEQLLTAGIGRPMERYSGLAGELQQRLE